jgi:probable F420-dependent oxidoreductase
MAGRLALGVTGIRGGPDADPERILVRSRRAEAAGFESVWAGEHIVIPLSGTRFDPETQFLDSIVQLSFVAAATKRIRIAPGVIVLPLRTPLVLAKQLASLDVLSGGRLIVGIGVGSLDQESEAVQVPFRERGARTDDYLAAMRAIWAGASEYHGRFVSFSGVAGRPLPVQRPHPPIVIGGHTEAAFRRAVERANGFYGWGQDMDAAAEIAAGLRAAAGRYERPPELGELELTIAPPGSVDAAAAAAYTDLGVHRLVLQAPESDELDAFGALVEATRA